LKGKQKILVFLDWYVPGFKAGGPIRSVYNIILALKDQYDFYVLTSAYDLGDIEPYSSVPLNQWTDVEGVLVKYLDRDHIKTPVIKQNVDEISPDIIYVNGIFSRYFSILPVRIGKSKNINTIVAPRGMLGKGALDVKKLKKTLFIKMSKITGLFDHVTWHASTQLEVDEIKNTFGKNCKVISSINIPSPQTLSIQDIANSKKFDEIRLVYIGRISPKKNLHKVIEWIQHFSYDKTTIFDIWGDGDEQEYMDQLKALIHPDSRVEINFKGPINPIDLPQVYAESHYFILLTKHENYGHVIAEAISNGCPVIVSDKTPWRNLSELGIGWDINIDKKSFLDTLNEAVHKDPIEYLKRLEFHDNVKNYQDYFF